MRILKNIGVTASLGEDRIEEIALTKEDLDAAREVYTPFLKAMLLITKDYDKGGPDAAVVKYLKSPEAIQGGLAFLRRYKFSSQALKLYETAVKKFATTKDYDSVEDPIEDLAVEMRDKIPSIAKDPAVPHSLISMLKDWSLVSRTGSDSAYNRLSSQVSLLQDTHLNQVYNHSKVEKSGGARSAVSELVKKLTGKPGIDIDPVTREKLAKAKPAAYKEFLAARRGLIALGKKKLTQIIRSSGKPLIDAAKAADVLTKEGFVHTVPKGFVGQVDETGALYTSAGKKILGGSGGATSVTMNPNYNATDDNAYVFSAISPKTGKALRVYTEDYRATKNHQKFKKTADFANQIEPIRAKWGAALMKDGNKSQPMALILEIAYQTQARIGNVGNNTEGKTTYGLTTLECRHANIMSQNKIRLLYPGKAFGKGGKDDGGSSRQKHYLIGEDKYSKKAVQLLRDFINTGSPSDPLIRWRDRRITSQSVNMYLKSLGSVVTVKTMRTMKGTLMARDLLSQSPFAKKPGAAPERKVTEWLKRALTKVGAQLGHMSGDKVTPNTAIRHYIDPSEIQNYYDAAGVRPPPVIEKILNHNRRL